MKAGAEDKSRVMDSMYGVINGLMCTPVAISFCSIIFRDPAFADYMPLLVKLVLFSSAIHQLSFSLFSSLPFAIGQVQDAGLIFLSGIAGSVVQNCQERGNTDAIIPTTLYTLAICTAALGLLLIATAKLRLATLVQYLPMPVIGGYLAYIGFFCGEAGIAMMANLHIARKSDWVLFLQWEAIVLYFPGLVCGILIYVALRRVRSPYVLPACMIVILSGFYAVMLLGGLSFEDVRRGGWVAPLSPVESVWESWKLYDMSLVQWDLLPDQFFPMIGMFLVVAFSSSLDIAAIEMELGLPLDYNRELNTVGLSNLFSGLLGGYTGSYIFSQTIFSLRRGVVHRVCGVVVALLELLVIALPFSITSYIPKLFFGSLLVLIATDLMYEWLYEARHKMMNYEYGICITTFFSIQALGIQLGMLLGVLVALAMFAFIYSDMSTVSPATLRSSSVIRTFKDRAVLMSNRGKVVTIALNGYIFFGSAVKVLEEITSKVELRAVSAPTTDSDEAEAPSKITTGHVLTPAKATPDLNSYINAFKSPSAEDLTRIAPSSASRTTPTLRLPGMRKNLVDRGHNLLSVFEDSNNADRLACDHHKRALAEEAGDAAAVTERTSLLGSSKSLYNSLSSAAGKHSAADAGEASAVAPLPHPFFDDGHGRHVEMSLASCIHAQSHHLHNHPHHHEAMKTVYTMSGEEIIQHYEFHQTVVGPDSVPIKMVLAGDDGVGNMKARVCKLSTPGRGQALLGAHDLEQGAIAEARAPLTAALTPTNLRQLCPPMASKFDCTIKEPALFSPGLSRVSEKATLRVSTDSLLLQPLGHGGVGSEASMRSGGWVVGEDITPKRPPIHAAAIDCLLDDSEKSSVSPHTIALLASPPPTNVTPASATPDAASRDPSSASFRTPEGASDLELLDVSSSFPDLGHLTPFANLPRTSTRGSMPQASFPPLPPFTPPAVAAAPADPPSRLYSHPKPTSRTLQRQSPGVDSEESVVVTEFLVLDFSKVLGVDATAARSCFRSLVNITKEAAVTIVFAQMPGAVEVLLRAHGVIKEDSVVIHQVDDALEWCENQVLLSHRQEPDAHWPKDAGDYSQAHLNRQNIPTKGDSRVSLTRLDATEEAKLLRSYAPKLRAILEDYLDSTNDADSEGRGARLLQSELLVHYFQREHFGTQEVVFEAGEAADQVYFIERGTVEIITVAAAVGEAAHVATASMGAHRPGGRDAAIRVNKVCRGGAFGEADFFLERSHSVRATSMGATVCWTLSREALARMEAEHPHLCMLLQHTLLKSLAIASTWATFALHPTLAYETGSIGDPHN